MFKILFALVPVGIILLISEFLWRKKILKGERARKFTHILAGVWMAFWPFYIPFDGIFILGCVALTFLLYSRHTHVFKSIYTVKRRTYGEIFYALAIVFCSYFGQEPWIFTISILLLALADGGAAVIGKNWGTTNQYRILRYKNLTKSVAGTVGFLIFAYVSVIIGWFIGGNEVMADHMFTVFFVLPISTTILENVSPFGLDNLITPALATVLLNSLL